ncbi:MAG: 23S rRNA (uracil(1939)-C(5))-methyltransferase RlmD [Lachnospiraceae bacterium]|jgi:23S rRNA (uracil1939-C5)-methyltransferase|nr:23S rRNA (uracil(1939)-C(5))-methyltransferase RlmD [Lachnospiraceae bacterium]
MGTSPYKKGDPVTAEITDIGQDGAGIGKAEGFAFFIKDAVLGDTVDARVMKVKSGYAYAKLEEVVKPSPFRVEPRCPEHARCGGCQLQALSYKKQLVFKQNKVRNNLIRLGGFSPTEIEGVLEEIVGMSEPFRYRCKAQYPLGLNKEGNIVAGFYAGRTHDIIPHPDCWLGDAQNKEILAAILAYMKENSVTAYDEKTGRGLVRHVLLRKGYYTGEVMVCLVINGESLPQQGRLVETLCKQPGITSISININSDNTNVIMGKEVRHLWGRETISDSLKIREAAQGFTDTGRSLSFQISPLSFYQVNPLQAEKIYALALEYAGLCGKETVYDLYCGIGTVSLFMAAKAKYVYGVEAVPEAVRDARRNAEANGVGNVEFIEGLAGIPMPGAEVIILDPPRKGCDRTCLQAVIAAQAKRIVYISCDSATLARDLRILCDNGYKLQRARPVDQFGQTVHVEVVCGLDYSALSNVLKMSSV